MTANSNIAKPSLIAHLRIARFDHWVKNVFVIPGVLIALSVSPPDDIAAFWIRVLLGFLSVGFVASSNYIINEVMDAPLDAKHPTKKFRPVPAGQVSIPLAYVQWIVFMVIGMALALRINFVFSAVMAALWIMGVIYNIPPVRSKDRCYIDVMTEAINNPLRLLAGWYIVRDGTPPPASLLVSYWMIGCYFMAIKRFAEYRELANPLLSAAYRKSFAFYTEQRLLVSIVFYASFAMLAFGAFVMRYRLEFVLAFPLIALVMAIYLDMAFKRDSAAQHPEKLYREPLLMLSVALCSITLLALAFVDIPALANFFTPLNSGVPSQR
jgi:decaprenyl-phosphate phosphoribosyltransferase